MRGYFFPPSWLSNLSGFLQTINATNLRVAFSFEAPKAGQLENVAIMFQAVTTPQTMRASFQNLASGQTYPDDTQDQFCDFTPVANTLVTVGPITSDGTSGGTRRTVAEGDRVCLVLEWAGATGVASLRYQTMDQGQFDHTFFHVRTGSWAANTKTPGASSIFALQYVGDSGWTYVPGAQVCTNASVGVSSSISVSSSPDEIGMKFTCPASRVKLAGLAGYLAVAKTNGQAFEIVLYDDATGLAIQTTTIQQMQASAFSSALMSIFDFDRSTLVALTAGAVYRVTIRPTGTGTVGIQYGDYPSAGMAQGTPFGNVGGIWTQRVNQGAWTDTDTRVPFIIPLFEDDAPPETTEVTFNPDDLAPVGLVWVEAYLPT